MYGFILNMWIMRRINEVHVSAYVSNVIITQAEAETILATPQMT